MRDLGLQHRLSELSETELRLNLKSVTSFTGNFIQQANKFLNNGMQINRKDSFESIPVTQLFTHTFYKQFYKHLQVIMAATIRGHRLIQNQYLCNQKAYQY